MAKFSVGQSVEEGRSVGVERRDRGDRREAHEQLDRNGQRSCLIGREHFHLRRAGGVGTRGLRVDFLELGHRTRRKGYNRHRRRMPGRVGTDLTSGAIQERHAGIARQSASDGRLIRQGEDDVILGVRPNSSHLRPRPASTTSTWKGPRAPCSTASRQSSRAARRRTWSWGTTPPWSRVWRRTWSSGRRRSCESWCNRRRPATPLAPGVTTVVPPEPASLQESADSSLSGSGVTLPGSCRRIRQGSSRSRVTNIVLPPGRRPFVPNPVSPGAAHVSRTDTALLSWL